MLLSPEMLLYTGPPPQAVLDQRWMWQMLCFLLILTTVARVLCLDIAGAMLSCLMLWLAVQMIRDGMRDMSKYCLVYTVLCSLNFFFDSLPLITELTGRVSRITTPVNVAFDGDTTETTFSVSTEVTPFFSKAEGFAYNMQSVSMILSPITMALGMYIALTASGEIGQFLAELYHDDNVLQADGALRERRLSEDSSGGGGNAQGGERGRSPPTTLARQTFERFLGRGQKLPS